MPLQIREMRVADADAVLFLSEQLSYAWSSIETPAQIKSITQLANDCVLVALNDSEFIGVL